LVFERVSAWANRYGAKGLQGNVANVRVWQMSAVSPFYHFSVMQRMAALAVEAKTFNNHLGFERGLWHVGKVNARTKLTLQGNNARQLQKPLLAIYDASYMKRHKWRRTNACL
jgi:hypothetical protein